MCGASLVTRVYLRRTRWGKDCNTNEMQSTDRVKSDIHYSEEKCSETERRILWRFTRTDR